MQTLDKKLRNSCWAIPIRFFSIKYGTTKLPSIRVDKKLLLTANCQLFVYNLLHHFGYTFLTFRSSELWKDKKYTRKVRRIKPLDILLFAEQRKAYRAHIGLYLGSNRVIHLSKEIGYPTVWDFKEFKKRKLYKIFIGAKRLKEI